ncbi:hypothetical protein DLJ53_18890 [Acuticoccus sediminis]|uniref:2Fe-2S ferredoxin-type domain-containing protein n=1 Tax=Acuticoccus sediminis TaxID=2184697 RepID=A0A8B2NJL9_9HYPH|nr:(2Fe-2S)-binding protein [Acuticoccus sediminis]RAH99824.1 hypothetical protein DLJ53_18890 [Acuticoccus sediminis]
MTQKMQMSLEVNGEPHTLIVEPRATLADALREELGLTGTRTGCEEGVCGACTVLVDGEPVRACLQFAVQAHGREVTTVEGLRGGEMMAALKDALAENFAVQCGFCTAGFLMLAAGAFARDPDMDERAMTELVSANLCRCTGYQPIVKAMMEAQAAMRVPAE